MENNKLIAEFMGAATRPKHAYAFLRYDSDWNWIMDVIEKIESMGCEVVHRKGDCNIYKIDEQENYRCIIEMQGINKLESTYKAIVEFIKNHEIL